MRDDRIFRYRLPQDAYLEVMKFLPAISLARFQQTCQSARSIVEDAIRQRFLPVATASAKLSTGSEHTLAIIKGQVVACGDNRFGQCGPDQDIETVSHIN